MEYKKCECGRCEELIPVKDDHYRLLKYKKGHRRLKESQIIQCACGCGELMSSLGSNRQIIKFIHGHHAKGSGNGRWKGGKIIEKGKEKFGNYDYYLIKNRDHPFANHAGYIREHRLVMEKHIGRYLTKQEVVHHINSDTLDNRIENLELYENSKDHLIKNHLKKDMSNRYCLNCNSKNTYIDRNNNSMWYKFKDGFLCGKCYKKVIKLKCQHS